MMTEDHRNEESEYLQAFQVFTKVEATLNPLLGKKLSSEAYEKLLYKHIRKNKLTIDDSVTEGHIVVSGDLNSIIKLQQDIMAAVHTILPHCDDERVNKFLTRLFSNEGTLSGKSIQKKSTATEATVNVTYSIVPFCYTLVKHYKHFRPWLNKVNLYVKNFSVEHNDLVFTISFKHSDKQQINEFKKEVNNCYTVDTGVIKHKLSGNENINALLSEIKTQFQHKFLIVLNERWLCIDLPERNQQHLLQKVVSEHQSKAKMVSPTPSVLTNGDVTMDDTRSNKKQLDVHKNAYDKITDNDSDYENDKSDKTSYKQCETPMSRPLNRDYIQQELEVDVDTMEYIRLFYHDELHSIADGHNLIINDMHISEGQLILMSFQLTNIPTKAVQEIEEFIHKISYDLYYNTFDGPPVKDHIEELWPKLKECGKKNKAWVTFGRDFEITVIAKSQDCDTAATEVHKILGSKVKKNPRQRILDKLKSAAQAVSDGIEDLVFGQGYRTTDVHSAASKRMKTQVFTQAPATAVSGLDSDDWDCFEEMQVDPSPSTSRFSVGNRSGSTSGSSSIMNVSTVVEHCTYLHMNTGVTVRAYITDITKLKVGAIVNAANEDMIHSGGIALAIARAGGTEFKRESKEYIRRNRVLKTGTACITTAGNMPSKKVIHTVGPIWSDQYAGECIKQLHEAFTSVLKIADKNNIKSIAIPAISSGIFGMPISLVADIAVTSITKFLEDNPHQSLTHISLVDIDDEIIILFRQELMKLVTAGKYSIVDKKVNSSSTSNNRTSVRSSPGQVVGVGARQKRSSSQSQDTLPPTDKPEEENCCICMCPPTKPKTLPCKHTFCEECIERGFKLKPACPICGKIYGKVTGDQPKNGKMSHSVEKFQHLAGYEHCGTIVIDYSFPDGVQDKDQQNPGQRYSGTHRRAYLPHNSEGQKVLRLLQQAFEARLIFTVGSSRTTGATNTVTWNDVHHKTNTHGGPEHFGYPDPTYLKRVQEELAAKGIQ